MLYTLADRVSATGAPHKTPIWQLKVKVTAGTLEVMLEVTAGVRG